MLHLCMWWSIWVRHVTSASKFVPAAHWVFVAKTVTEFEQTSLLQYKMVSKISWKHWLDTRTLVMYSVYCFTGQRAVYGKYMYNAVNTLYCPALVTCSKLQAFLHHLFPFVVRCFLKLLVHFKWEIVEGQGLYLAEALLDVLFISRYADTLV